MRVKSGFARRRGLEKRLDGWQLGLTVVLAAWAITMVVVPRPIMPMEVPEPLIDPREIEAIRTREVDRAREARSQLSEPARALGGAIRALGRAEAKRDGAAASVARQQITAARAAIPDDGLETVLSLRALQASTFVGAVRAWEKSGATSRDLEDLGGGLVTALRDVGWCIDHEGGRSTILLSDDELGVAFRKRWNEIVGMMKGPAKISITEEKLLFAFAIRHLRVTTQTADPVAARAVGARSLLRRIDELARLDPSYPADFARGVAYLGASAFGPAQLAFQRHLAAHPDGPLTLRAHNFGRAAMVGEVEGYVP